MHQPTHAQIALNLRNKQEGTHTHMHMHPPYMHANTPIRTHEYAQIRRAPPRAQGLDVDVMPTDVNLLGRIQRAPSRHHFAISLSAPFIVEINMSQLLHWRPM